MEKEKRCNHPMWDTQTFGFPPNSKFNETCEFDVTKYVQTCQKCKIIRVVKIK